MDKLQKIISPDPYDYPFEGEDYYIEDNGTISVSNNNARLAGMICHKVNRSGKFEHKLTRFGTLGGVIILGFDKLAEKEPVFKDQLGKKKNISVEIRELDGIYYIYINGQRRTNSFLKLSTAKAYGTRMSKHLDSLDRESKAGYDFVDLD